MKRRRINPDAWWYIERPFPWLFFAWPLLAMYGLWKDVIHPPVSSGGEPVYIGTEPPPNTHVEITRREFLLGRSDPIYVKRGPAGEPVVVYLHPESGR